MRIKNLLCFAALVLLGSVPLVAADTGDLKIRFEYGGDAVPPSPLNPDKDKEFCGKHGLVSEKLLVNKENKGLKNVVVYVYTGRRGSDIPDVPPAKNTHTLANKNCRFEPHIVITQTGDTLRVTNPDPVGHNANLGFFNNQAQNFTIPSGQEKSVELAENEPAPIPIACNIHPWMISYVLVLDHPYAAVSDENGDLIIKGLPAGDELVFRAFHESARIGEVTVDGKKTEWKSARFEVDIKPGMNDLGTVVLPADSFNAD